MNELHSIGPKLAASNRRLLAQRLSWPEGALQVCERLELESPRWSICWAPGDGLNWTEPGFYALRGTWHFTDSCPPWVYGVDEEALRQRIADCEPVEHGLPR